MDIDAAMADVVARASEPTLAAIKLAWWRERLEELDEGKVPAEPRLRAAADHLLSCGVSGRTLAALEAGYAELLQPAPDAEIVLQRGARLFAIAAGLLGAEPWLLTDATGRLYAAGQLQRMAIGLTGAFVTTGIRAVPRRLRPLTALAVLANRDLDRREPEATPARAFALLRHRLTGRIG